LASGRRPLERLLGWVWQDLRYAVRSLHKDRRFTLLAVLALALGIGSATIIFSAIYGVLIDTFPYQDAHHLVNFEIHSPADSGRVGRNAYTIAEFLDFREQNHVFTDVNAGFGGFGNSKILYATGQGTVEFNGGYLSANSFEFFGVPPLLGRWPTPEDTKPGATPVFTMSARLWREQFNGDPNILGKSFTLNGVPRTLVAIMPPRFRPGWNEILVPFPLDKGQIANDPAFAHEYVWPLGHLKPGISLKAAAADLDVVAHNLAKIYPDRYPKEFTVITWTLADAALGPFRDLLYPLIAAVLLLLLIACSNVANLLLSRATARDKEIAIRASIGASRGRLIRQFLVESSVLAATACAAGCLLAYIGIKWMVPFIPYYYFPQEAVIELNPMVLLFSLAVTILTTVLCGVAPAIHAFRGELQSRLMGTAKGAGGGFRHSKLRGTLVVSEVALSIILLIGAGLMMRTFFKLTHVDLGFNPQRLFVAQVMLPKDHYATPAQRKLFYQQFLQRVAAVPGVIAVAQSISRPPYGGATSDVNILGKTHSETWTVTLDACSEGLSQAMGLHVLRGRFFSEADVASARKVAVINRSFARKYFANDEPIGQELKFGFLDQVPDAPHDASFEIVGVVSDVSNDSLQRPPAPQAYIPDSFLGFGAASIIARTTIDPASLVATIHQQLWAVDPHAVLIEAGSLDGLLNKEEYSSPHFELIVLGAFSTIGLVLIVIGVFSVMAYSVSLQTHEIGIRMALGAQKGNILTMVLRNGLNLIVAGILLGFLASIALTRLIASQLSGVKPTDPWTFGIAAVIILAAGLAACFFPARRATQVDPLVALRYE
jgi:putative ABC transport system permease protein